MKYQNSEKNDSMGEFHNQLIQLVDMTTLSPPEVITILRMIASNIERLFEISVKGQ
jgi:hypothetical protein